MSFTSTIYRGERVIDDDTPVESLECPPEFSRGLELGFRSGAPDDYAYGDAATPFPPEWLISESEWEPRIKEMEEQKSRVSDRINMAGLPCKNQEQTNYCWINAPVHTLEIMRVMQNQPMVILSPASAGGPIKGYRNVGGWGKEGLLRLISHGCNSIGRWPANAISSRYATAENAEEALLYRVVEWIEIRPRNIQQLMSCLLRRIPIAVGYNWWTHEVTLYDPVWVNGGPGGRMRNSWGMNWPNAGAAGYSILTGSKLLPDDAVAPLSAIAA
jgi:hypothetical protein